jgi:hypothetical protein
MLRLVVLSLLVTWSGAQVTQYVGQIPLTNVDLVNTFNHTNPANNRQRFSVLASTYNTERASYDTTFVFLYPGNHKPNNFSGFTGSNLFNFLYWPKEVRQVPGYVFGHDAIFHPDGSTVLQKTAGSLYVSDVSNMNFPATYDIAARVIPLPIPESLMYNSGVWFQVDADLRDDLVTCRVELTPAGAIVRARIHAGKRRFAALPDVIMSTYRRFLEDRPRPYHCKRHSDSHKK